MYSIPPQKLVYFIPTILLKSSTKIWYNKYYIPTALQADFPEFLPSLSFTIVCMSCEEEQFSGRKEKSVTEITVFFVWVNLARNFLNMGSSLSSSFSSSSSSSSPLSKAFKRRARKRLSTWEINHKRKKMNYSETSIKRTPLERSTVNCYSVLW